MKSIMSSISNDNLNNSKLSGEKRNLKAMNFVGNTTKTYNTWKVVETPIPL